MSLEGASLVFFILLDFSGIYSIIKDKITLLNFFFFSYNWQYLLFLNYTVKLVILKKLVEVNILIFVKKVNFHKVFDSLLFLDELQIKIDVATYRPHTRNLAKWLEDELHNVHPIYFYLFLSF